MDPTPFLFTNISDLCIIVFHCVGHGRNFREHLVQPALLLTERNRWARPRHVPRVTHCIWQCWWSGDSEVCTSDVSWVASECPTCVQERQICTLHIAYALRSLTSHLVAKWPYGPVQAGPVVYPHRDRYLVWVCLPFLSAESQPAPLSRVSQKA